MVYLRINISERTNRILNAIKTEHGLKNKSEAVKFLAEWYEKNVLTYQR
jgi:hypothetical protein